MHDNPRETGSLASLASLAGCLFALVAPACSRPDPPVAVTTPSPAPAPAPAPPPAPAPAPAGEHHASLGNVMTEVARRFEVAGKAAAANRYELVEYEVGELGELFEDDVPTAEMPKEGPTAHIPKLAKAFLEASIPELKKAAATKDPAAFKVAFEHASAACNGCHAASEKPFLEVPSTPGRDVPELSAAPVKR